MLSRTRRRGTDAVERDRPADRPLELDGQRGVRRRLRTCRVSPLPGASVSARPAAGRGRRRATVSGCSSSRPSITSSPGAASAAPATPRTSIFPPTCGRRPRAVRRPKRRCGVEHRQLGLRRLVERPVGRHDQQPAAGGHVDNEIRRVAAAVHDRDHADRRGRDVVPRLHGRLERAEQILVAGRGERVDALLPALHLVGCRELGQGQGLRHRRGAVVRTAAEIAREAVGVADLDRLVRRAGGERETTELGIDADHGVLGPAPAGRGRPAGVAQVADRDLLGRQHLAVAPRRLDRDFEDGLAVVEVDLSEVRPLRPPSPAAVPRARREGAAGAAAPRRSPPRRGGSAPARRAAR